MENTRARNLGLLSIIAILAVAGLPGCGIGEVLQNDFAPPDGNDAGEVPGPDGSVGDHHDAGAAEDGGGSGTPDSGTSHPDAGDTHDAGAADANQSDAGVADAGVADAGPSSDAGSAPDAGGPVGPGGGTVTLLKFGVTGDTRPSACEKLDYPVPVINSIADAMKTQNVQFAMDLGDHMYVCNGDVALARSEMSTYTTATGRYPGTWFMTMGNHECYGGFCDLTSTNANYVAFMESLKPIATKPYYSFDVQTSLGLATFVVVADNAWTPAQKSWLDATLATADTKAKYTIVARHHPEGDSSVSTNPAIMTVIRAHKFALFLSGHAHHYTHQTTDNGRDVVIGIGGAPLVSSGTFYGYGLIEQQANGNLDVKMYDVTSGSLKDSFSVGPNQ